MKYRKSLTYLLLLTLLPFLLSGCWDSDNIEQRNLLSFVIVDYSEDQYHFYVETANIFGSKSISERSSTEFSVLHSSGSTFLEAREALNRASDHLIYLGTTRAVAFTKSMAEKGIEEYINRIRGEADYRKSIQLITTSTEPMEFITDQTDNETSVGDAVESTLDSNVEIGEYLQVTVGDVVETLAIDQVGFFLPEMNLVGNEITLTGYSIFQGDQGIGIVPTKESKGMILLLHEKPVVYYTVHFKDTHYAISVELKKRTIEATYENGKICFDVSFQFKAIVHYMDHFIKITEKELGELTALLNEQVIEDIRKATETSQVQFSSDYLSFYKYFRARYSSEFQKMNWNKKYPSAEISIGAKTEIIGSLGQEILTEGK